MLINPRFMYVVSFFQVIKLKEIKHQRVFQLDTSNWYFDNRREVIVWCLLKFEVDSIIYSQAPVNIFYNLCSENLILVQIECWRRGWGMQVERTCDLLSGRSYVSGGRVSNTWITYPLLQNNSRKRLLILNEVRRGKPFFIKVGDLVIDLTVRERFMRYQLVGVVTAHQG